VVFSAARSVDESSRWGAAGTHGERTAGTDIRTSGRTVRRAMTRRYGLATLPLPSKIAPFLFMRSGDGGRAMRRRRGIAPACPTVCGRVETTRPTSEPGVHFQTSRLFQQDRCIGEEQQYPRNDIIHICPSRRSEGHSRMRASGPHQEPAAP
jgi:hypothetical protein